MLTVRQAVSGRDSIYRPQPANILSVRRQTALENLYALRMQDGTHLHQEPGQFVMLSVLGAGECPISICSGPSDDGVFELSVRRVGEVTSAIHRLGAGDVVGVRGPLGHGFDVRDFQERDILIVVGGCALAPARSLIHAILGERARYGAFHLLYGARSPDEILFPDEVRAWQARSDVNCHVTVDHSAPGWTGPVGVVTTLFSGLPRLDPPRTRVAIIGPPLMFKFAMLGVLERGIAQEHIYCSLERRMKCGVGRCGHCQINGWYGCVDGPVFNYAELAGTREAIE
jgi:NAD(P)H-flavin reductase